MQKPPAARIQAARELGEQQHERGNPSLIPALYTVLVLALCLIFPAYSSSGVNQPGPLSEQRL